MREAARELQQATNVRAPEPVDRLVGVADNDQITTVTRDGAKQLFLRGVGVLVLIDEHRAVAGTDVLQHGSVGEQGKRLRLLLRTHFSPSRIVCKSIS